MPPSGKGAQTLEEFLRINKNTGFIGGNLPVIHTTQAAFIDDFIETSEIKPAPCDVFIGEDLSYFFFGRPAYKYRGDGRAAYSWELPISFMINYEKIGDIHRIFPFDSGAFYGKEKSGGVMPPSIDMFRKRNPDHDTFSLPGDRDIPPRIIGAFFGSVGAYLGWNRQRPKGLETIKEQFKLTVRRSAPIMAVASVYSDLVNDSIIDDRSRTLEIQKNEPLELTADCVEAVVLPQIMYDDDVVKEFVESTLNAEPLLYSYVDLDVERYFAHIYEKVFEFYKKRGYL